MDFEYMDAEERMRSGKISIVSRYDSRTVELDVQANGYFYHIITGKHQGGNYICVPNHYIGSELSSLDDYFWNKERLMRYASVSENEATIIARALKAIYPIIK